MGKPRGREKEAKTRECEKKGENLCQRADKENRRKDRKCCSGRTGEKGMRGSERVERCTTTKYDDAAVGTRLTPSKNDRRCLPCFLRASQFPTSLLLVVSSLVVSPVAAFATQRHPILDAVTPGFRGISSRCVVRSIQGLLPANWHCWCDRDGMTREIFAKNNFFLLSKNRTADNQGRFLLITSTSLMTRGKIYAFVSHE